MSKNKHEETETKVEKPVSAKPTDSFKELQAKAAKNFAQHATAVGAGEPLDSEPEAEKPSKHHR